MNQKDIFIAAAMVIGFQPLVLAAQSEKKNILFIFSDDQSPYTIGAYRQVLPHMGALFEGFNIHTPEIDRIAEEGVILTGVRHQGASVQAVCRASRCLVFSGGLNLWENAPGGGSGLSRPAALGLDQRVESEGLQIYNDGLLGRMEAAGYETFYTGKTGAGYSAGYPVDFPFVDFLVPNDTRIASTSRVIADDTISYLNSWKARGKAKPFFATVAHPLPHEPRPADATIQQSYLQGPHVAREDWNRTPNFGFQLKPPQWPNYIGGQDDLEYPFYPYDLSIAHVTEEERSSFPRRSRHRDVIAWNQAREHAVVENMDSHLGRVFQWLRDEGLYDETMIIYTSDHGLAMGQHGLVSKQSLYEHSLLVPMIVRGPGIEKGVKGGQLYLHDIAATILDWGSADSSLLDADDGISMASYLSGEEGAARTHTWHRYTGASGGDGAPRTHPFYTGIVTDYQICQPFPTNDGRENHFHQVAVVQGGWKLITTYQGPNATATNTLGHGKTQAGNPRIVREEFFVLQSNPWELLPTHTMLTTPDGGANNLETRAALRSLRDSELKFHDDPWFDFEQESELTLLKATDGSILTIALGGNLESSIDGQTWTEGNGETVQKWEEAKKFFRLQTPF